MRQAQFSLLYEVIGLIIFSVTALIWFGGIESLMGGLTQGNAINSFNQLTSAISAQCVGAVEPTIVSGLDLTTYGSTFIMTQLSIPEAFRGDPETMGFIQPQMRKCVGTNCLCLLELNEAEGNWQMCTTSDFDSWNLELGAETGPPGCPFWYYAPPRMIEQSVQGVLDLLDLNLFQIALSATGVLGTATETYSYPAPEMWGGCSGSTEANLQISSFTDENAVFDCTELQDSLYTYFDKSRQWVLDDLGLSFDKSFLNSEGSITYYESLVNNNLISNINAVITPTLINYFLNPIKSVVINDYDSIIYDSIFTNLNEDGLLLTTLKANLVETLTLIAPDEDADLLADEVISALTSSLSDSYFNSNIISHETSAYYPILNTQAGTMTFPLNDLPENLDSITVSLSVQDATTIEDEGSIIVLSLDSCQKSSNIISDEFTTVEFSFTPSCLNGSSMIIIKEGNNDESHSFNVLLGAVEPLLISTLNNEEIDDDWAINISFNEKQVNSEVTDFVLSQLASSVLTQSLIGTSYPEVTDYETAVSNALSIIDFSSVPSSAYSSLTNFYDNYFESLVDEKLYDSYCNELINPAEELLSSRSEAVTDLSSSISASFDGLISLSSLDLSLTVPTDFTVDVDLTSSLDSLSLSLAREQITYIKTVLATHSIELTTIDEAELINDYYEPLSATLSELSASILSDFNTANEDINDISLPASFSFTEEFNDFITTTGSSINNAFLSYHGSAITNGLTVTAQLIEDTINPVVAEGWSGQSVFEVPCWPKTNGGYFNSYNAVNDLLGYRRYTSVSRLAPVLTAFAFDSLTGALNAVTIKKFQSALISNSVGLSTSSTGDLLIDTAPRYHGVLQVDDFEAFILASEGILNDFTDTLVAGTDLMTITGDISLSGVWKIFRQAGEGVAKLILKDSVKQFFKDNIGLIITTVAANIGINFLRNTMLTHLNSEEVVYSSGGIRTFDPDVISVRACVTMEELGCEATDAIWVNESYYCQTDVTVRRLINPTTWFQLMRDQDECRHMTANNTACFEQGGECYVDTLTACYKLSCKYITNDVDRYHVFQYWVGASGDPAGMLGARSGAINALKVYSFGGKIMMEVLGGNATVPIPPSVV
ncbi:MAG: hypothetical protein WC307_04015 [Candidatus Nanoarchaeia archaeon]